MLRNMLLTASMAILASGSLEDLAHCDPLRKDMRKNRVSFHTSKGVSGGRLLFSILVAGLQEDDAR